MIDNIEKLERLFREKRVYGDREDFKLFKPRKEKDNPNCNVLVNEFYSWSGFPFMTNEQAEGNLNNYEELSVECVLEAIEAFIRYKFEPVTWMEMPLFRTLLNKPPVLLNTFPLPLPDYFDANEKRKEDFHLKNPFYGNSSILRAIEKKRLDCSNQIHSVSINDKDSEEELIKKYDAAHLEFVNKMDEIIREHIEETFGKIEYSLLVDYRGDAPFYIHQIPASNGREFGLIITSGNSSLPMNMSNARRMFKFVEFVIPVKKDFPFPLELNENYDFYWIIFALIQLIWNIYLSKGYTMHDHTFMMPPTPIISSKTKFAGFYLQFPFEIAPSYFTELTIPDWPDIYFLQLIPLFKEEIDFYNNKGGLDLMSLFKSQQVSLILSEDRKHLNLKKING